MGFWKAKTLDVPQHLPITDSNYAALNGSTEEILSAEAARASAAQNGANIRTQPQELPAGRDTHRARRRVS